MHFKNIFVLCKFLKLYKFELRFFISILQVIYHVYFLFNSHIIFNFYLILKAMAIKYLYVRQGHLLRNHYIHCKTQKRIHKQCKQQY